MEHLCSGAPCGYTRNKNKKGPYIYPGQWSLRHLLRWHRIIGAVCIEKRNPNSIFKCPFIVQDISGWTQWIWGYRNLLEGKGYGEVEGGNCSSRVLAVHPFEFRTTWTYYLVKNNKLKSKHVSRKSTNRKRRKTIRSSYRLWKFSL